jgi:hypothetical protein
LGATGSGVTEQPLSSPVAKAKAAEARNSWFITGKDRWKVDVYPKQLLLCPVDKDKYIGIVTYAQHHLSSRPTSIHIL